jgi:IS4 transposase
VCDLYRRRWDIEVFFKQVKQSLKLGSFLGHSANAVRWQVPKLGIVIFAAASILKDTTNRIGDIVDDGKSNQSFNG